MLKANIWTAKHFIYWLSSYNLWAACFLHSVKLIKKKVQCFTKGGNNVALCFCLKHTLSLPLGLSAHSALNRIVTILLVYDLKKQRNMLVEVY